MVRLLHTPQKNVSPSCHALEIDNEIVIGENDYVHFQVSSSINENLAIWLSDFRFPLILNEVKDGNFYYCMDITGFFDNSELSKFTSPFLHEGRNQIFYKLFLNNFGRCDIQIEANGTYIQIGYVEIRSEKIRELDDLLDYLHFKNIFYWEGMTLTKSKAKEEDEHKYNILWTLNFIDETLTKIDEEFIPIVHYDKFFRLVHGHRMEKWKESTVDDRSLNWLAENLEKLEKSTSTDVDHFLINNRAFKIGNILSDFMIEETDVYENQIVHQYSVELYEFLNESKRIIKSKKANATIDSFRARLFLSFATRIEERIDRCISRILNVKNSLDQIIPIRSIKVDLSNPYRMMSKPHYSEIYTSIITWMQKGIILYNDETLFTGTKDIAKLYEIFCLYSLIDSIETECGFRKTQQSTINQFKISEDLLFEEKLNINSYYQFKHKDEDIILELNYESLPIGLTTTSKFHFGKLRPDFVLTIKRNGRESFLILDAKYKKTESIETYDYQELCLKYLHGIGSARGGYTDIIGLIVLNPIDKSGMEYYHKSQFDLNHDKPILPIIGRLEMRPDADFENGFASLLQNIFNKILKKES